MASNLNPILEVNDLAAVRGENRLFQGLNFRLESGQLLFIQGGNGCGKTSLLYILAGLRLPESGTISWGGADINQLGKLYHQQLCFIGHQNGVKAELTVWENIQGFQSLSCFEKQDIQAIVDRIGLAGFEDSLAYTLSSGQKRRLALSRLFMSKQALWILDEPFTSLDKASVRMIESMLVGHSQAGGMVILTSHQALDLSGGEALHLELERAA